MSTTYLFTHKYSMYVHTHNLSRNFCQHKKHILATLLIPHLLNIRSQEISQTRSTLFGDTKTFFVNKDTFLCFSFLKIFVGPACMIHKITWAINPKVHISSINHWNPVNFDKYYLCEFFDSEKSEHTILKIRFCLLILYVWILYFMVQFLVNISVKSTQNHTEVYTS